MAAKFCPLLFGAVVAMATADPPTSEADSREAAARHGELMACKGSGCMMWRTMDGADGGAGYCGLADRPAPGEAVPDPQSNEVPDGS